MRNLQAHYQELVGLDKTWKVDSVDLNVAERRVRIRLVHQGGRLTCPECQSSCGQADLAPDREWRHLDTMQFETILEARVPRCQCPTCGVKTIAVCWADKHSRFTLLFEGFAIEVLKASSSVQEGSALLDISWDVAHSIMERAVKRGLERRQLTGIRYLGMDEKSFRRGQSYVSVLTDLDNSRVLEVVEERTEQAANKLWNTLSEEQRTNVRAVAMDMCSAYVTAAETNVPEAAVVHDKFHVSKHLNEAVDQVRRQEHKLLAKLGDDTLKGTRQLWLFSPGNMKASKRRALAAIKRLDLKTARAWAIKEHFRCFWRYVYPTSANLFFKRWYAWAVRSRLAPVIKRAKMLKKHLHNLLTYTLHPITNAKSEGFNSKIQAIKAAARGFRNFANYRTRILFFCGDLTLMPTISTH